MIDKNAKRYVYFDKYLEYQADIAKKFKKLDNKVNLLTIIAMSCILSLSGLLYKIFG